MQKPEMTSSRLEAFSDGVIAIIITIMVLEFKVPHDGDPHALLKLWPIFLSYGFSFIMVAVYWVNHHHMFHFVKRVDSVILWANNFLLFCLSLVPFFTAYLNDHEQNSFSTACYSGILLTCAIAYTILRMAISREIKNDAQLQLKSRYDAHKNWFAIVLYLTAIFTAYIYPPISLALNAIVAILYAMPRFYLDKNI